MIRFAIFLILAGIAAAIVHVLLFTGGHSYNDGFVVENVEVRYMINAPGVIRPERLEYVILSDGRFEEQTIEAGDGKRTSFSRVYRDGDTVTTVAFTTKPGQTVWIGKDRKARLASVPLRMKDVWLLKQHRGDKAIRVSSLEELHAVLAKLKAETRAAPNGAK